MTGPGSERLDLTADEVAILERRAERLRARPATEVGDDELLWVAELEVGAARYAFPLASLRAAVPLQAVTPVPLCAPDVLGILRFQGQVVLAYSLAALLGSSGWQQDPAVLVVLEAGPGEVVAFDAERVPKPLALAIAAVEAARASRAGALALVATAHGPPVRLIDIAALLAGRRGARHAP